MQITNMFGVTINKDIVRRVLGKHYKPTSTDDGPSWLTFIDHAKDSLWSIDFFRTESIHVKSHWVMVMIDQFTRLILGFSVHQGHLSGIDICCMLNKIISGLSLPKYLSSDNDPLFTSHRWQANLRIMDIEEIKTVPYTPISHPFVERVIGTVRRELLDQTLFWTANNLQSKLDMFQKYYNDTRCHTSIEGSTPHEQSRGNSNEIINMNDFRWKKQCRGLFNLPIAA
jgi:putative transposase